MPKVSIIIPCYNCGQYLDELITSLKNQTLTDIEIIFVDDGSSDNSQEIIQKYAVEDNRIKYIYQENQGGGIARNTGIANAQSPYVICIDADDMYEKDMAEMLYNRAIETDADITICKYKTWNMTTNRISGNKGINLKPEMINQVFSSDSVKNILQISNPGPCNKLYKIDFIKQNNLKYSGTRIINDLKFGMLALCLAKKIAIVDKDLSTYRYQGNCSSSKNREKKLACSLQVFKEIYNEFAERNLYDKFETTYISKIIESIKYEISFPVPETVLDNIQQFFEETPFDKLKKQDLENLFDTKRTKKHIIEYTFLTIITLGLNFTLKHKLKNYKYSLNNLKYILRAKK
ncbi:glycosyltransferase family 2 protein [bacterium]|nr:glycosyltransferase family 2 protein [bacterium]